MASAGVSTMGSPLMLNEVFNNTGTPVIELEFLEQPVKPGVVLLPNRLHASCAVNVDDGRNPVSPFRANVLASAT